MGENLAALAKQVLTNYNINVIKTSLIQGEALKVVWKIDTSGGALCLKRLRHPIDKMRFSIAAQKYMAENGAKVPKIISTADGEDWVEQAEQVFVLYEWVDGRRMVMDRVKDLQLGVEGIAGFHLAAAGFAPPPCRISTKLGKWPDHYRSIEDRFNRWKAVAKARPQSGGNKAFLENVDNALSLVQEAQQFLAQSSYDKWVKEIDKQKCLCHQDYGDGNALVTKSGVYVLDLDNVTLELPARDLRKIITKRMVTKGAWDQKLLNDIVHWYEQVNPLTMWQKKVLYIDLLFPHEFHALVKNQFLKNEALKTANVEQIAKWEREKRKQLLPLLAR